MTYLLVMQLSLAHLFIWAAQIRASKNSSDTVCSLLWMKDSLIGKVGAVFTSGGGCELPMLAMLNNFTELGMLMVPLPRNTPGYAVGGFQWGPNGRSMGENMEQTGIAEEKLETATHHGANISRVASVLKGHELFAKPNPVAVE